MDTISIRHGMSYWGYSLPDFLLLSWDALVGRAVWGLGLVWATFVSQYDGIQIQEVG